MKFVMSFSLKHLHRVPIIKDTHSLLGGILDPLWGGVESLPAPIPLCVSFCVWIIHGFPAQSKDPYFVQDNPWIVQIHTLSLTYVIGYGKTAHFAHYFKIELLVFKCSVDLKQ